MSEQDIIQAFECCSSEVYKCYDCPLRSELRPKSIQNPCSQILIQEAMELIKNIKQ